MTNAFHDGRDDLPIFIHSELDDLSMKAETFRVYCHLARRAGKNGEAFPSYQSMGDICFSKDYPNSKVTRRKHAIAAVKELIEMGLVRCEKRKTSKSENQSNIYKLTPKREWRRGGSTTEPHGSTTEPHGSTTEPGVVPPQNPKVLHSEDHPKEGNPLEGSPLDSPTFGGIIYNPEAELQDFDRADSKKLDLHDERNFEPESRTNRLASLSKEEGGYSTTVKAAKKERLPRAAVAKKQPTPEETIAHDEDGWLVLPCKSKEFPRYKLPAAIALRRMHYEIAIEFLDKYFEFFEDEDGKWWVEDAYDNQTRSLASFEKAHPLKQVIELARSTKDSVKTTHQLDQNWFNEHLYKFYLDAIAFCDGWGSEAQSQSKSAPPFVLWDDL